MKCSNCDYINSEKANFCGKCGKKVKNAIVTSDYNKHVKKISFFFFTLVAYIVFLNLVELGNNYFQTLILDSIFAIIVLVFYFVDSKEVNKLFQFKKLKDSLILKILIFTPILAILVSSFVGYVNQNMFNVSDVSYYEFFIDSPSPLLLSIVSIGLFPAIFEEIAFRGILFNELTKITRLKSSIIISAILFTILHFSLISILWIFPLGLLFGYFRARYRTIWYGIIGHFVYNSSIVLIEIYYMS